MSVLHTRAYEWIVLTPFEALLWPYQDCRRCVLLLKERQDYPSTLVAGTLGEELAWKVCTTVQWRGLLRSSRPENTGSVLVIVLVRYTASTSIIIAIVDVRSNHQTPFKSTGRAASKRAKRARQRHGRSLGHLDLTCAAS